MKAVIKLNIRLVLLLAPVHCLTVLSNKESCSCYSYSWVFNDAFDSLEYIAWNDRMISESWIGLDAKLSDRGLI
jgi:hypothetical protein